ncbi:hypothetical protein [Chryseobacterium kwangjuense]|uniref:Uncharacterized protein n=1 Tax=Chryseobacterium kwangjuense TaxID=267125 RepID=A0A135WIV3_9FLAO|nr:hypothetical protein [Chryseobacterium kwangjuense]KXH84858.1 hypothetical protein AU378_03630 [Chryseobacterium kwangjuense]
MKKFFLTIFFFCSVIILNSCKKDSSLPVNEGNKIDEISNNLVNSETFASSLDSIVLNTMVIFKELNKVGGVALVKDYVNLSKLNPSYNDLKEFYLKNNLDAERFLLLHAKNLANVLVIMNKHPELTRENADIQSNVFYNISARLRTNYELSGTKIARLVGKKLNPFKDNARNIGLRASGDDPTTPDTDPSRPPADMTWQDVGACALEAVGGAIVGSFKLFKQLHGVITGYNLGYSGIVNVATSAFRTAVGSNAGVMAITFAVCIAKEYFFGNEVVPPPTDWAGFGDPGDEGAETPPAN